MKESRRAEGLLALLLLSLVALNFAFTPDPAVRNWRFLPDMVTSPAYGTFEQNPVLPDGMTLQPPPAGTIPRGLPPLAADGVLLDTTTVWEQLTPDQRALWDGLASPVPEEARAAAGARGGYLFTHFCLPCHGAGAAGDGPVVQRGVPPPPTLLSDEAKAFSDGRIFRAMTCGKGNMASYAAQIPRNERWNVVCYLRRLQTP